MRVMMIQFAKELSKIPAEKYEGWYMGKAEYEIFGYSTNAKKYNVQVLNENKRLAVIKSIEQVETKITSQLIVFLINSSLIKVNRQKIRNGSEFWYCFTTEEVHNFSKSVGDKNSIHYGEKPIVQGLLILGKVKNFILYFSKIEIRFHNTIYAEDAIYISRQENTVLGYSCGKLCFTASIKDNRGINK